MIDEFDRYTYATRLFEERKYRDAARELEGVLEAAGETTYGLGDARLLLARAYYHSAQLGRAEQATRELVESDPTDTYAMLLLARTLERAGRGEEANGWYHRADALTPA